MFFIKVEKHVYVFYLQINVFNINGSTHRVITAARQADTRFAYPKRMRGWAELTSVLVIYLNGLLVLRYNNNIYLGKSNQAARKGTGPSKLATQKSNKENAIHAQKNIRNKNMLSIST